MRPSRSALPRRENLFTTEDWTESTESTRTDSENSVHSVEIPSCCAALGRPDATAVCEYNSRLMTSADHRRSGKIGRTLQNQPKPILKIETRSLPEFARRYPRDFTFYVAHPVRSILFILSKYPVRRHDLLHQQRTTDCTDITDRL